MADEFGGELLGEKDEFGGVAIQGAAVEPGRLSAVQGTLGGINTALANIAGLPVDVAAAGINLGARALGVPEIEQPFLGSESIKAGLESTGVLSSAEFDELSRPAQIGFRAGEVVGASIPFAAGPLAAVRLGVQGPKFLQSILQAAKASPGKFTAIEAGGAAGAAQAAGLVEAIDPEAGTLARFGAEVAGGIVNPAGLAIRATGGLGKSVVKLVRSMTRAGREDEAARILRTIVESTGEDSAQLIRLLEESGEFTLTSGRKTGSPALLALESRLAVRNAEFEGRAKELTERAFKDMRQVIDGLVASGDPGALRAAAQIRQRHFDDLLSQRLQVAQQRAAEVSARLGGDKRAASSAAFEQIDTSLKEARKIESELWEKIPKDITLAPTSLKTAKEVVKGRLLKEETFPFQASINRLLKEGETTTGELLKLRSRLLAQGRELRAQKKFSDASIANELADSVLDDLSRIEISQVDEARAFSRSLNETFTQTFAGQGLAKTAQGGLRIPPELLLDRAFGRGGDVRFRELRKAGEFSGGVFGNVVRNEQESFLRAISERVVENGVINQAKLRTFLTNNRELINAFPSLSRDLSDLDSAATLINQVRNANKVASQAIKEKAAFARLLNVENPSTVIGRVLRGATPEKDFNQLARLAKKSGPGAVAGFKTATLDNAVNVASKGGFTFSKFKSALFDPTGRFSAVDQLRANNIISIDETKRLNQILDKAIGLESSLKAGRRIDELIGEPDALFDLVIRIAGANIGGASVVGQAAGAPIVAAGAGSRFARNLFEKVPATKVTDVLVKGAENPKFMAALLRRSKTPKERRALERQINAFLLQAGIVSEEE